MLYWHCTGALKKGAVLSLGLHGQLTGLAWVLHKCCTGPVLALAPWTGTDAGPGTVPVLIMPHAATVLALALAMVLVLALVAGCIKIERPLLTTRS